MDIFSIILIILGLCLFEIIISVDNAIINAEVLSTMTKRARRWFLIWGVLIAIFLVRGALPWAIVWANNPSLGPMGAFTASFSNDPHVKEVIEKSSPILLIGGGCFLVFLFLHWLFLEPKHYGLAGEKFVHRQGVWFFAIVSVLLVGIVWMAIRINPMLALGATAGSSAFFVVHGFRQKAEQKEIQLLQKDSSLSDFSKIMYLEVIDATFSIDGILGAFAFTFSIPLILLGNGIGAIVVRQLTVSNIDNVKKYKYLKNGAMYSIFFLGIIMLLHAFGSNIPAWFSPLVTFTVVGYFFFKSARELKNEHAQESRKRKAKA
ncbi:MAG: DUF475 domain-containing protein [Nanoarchaeota archaeon]|nr:MAG: DUF475 domain-containing protein [Nanoarchaeota archaeon]